MKARPLPLLLALTACGTPASSVSGAGMSTGAGSTSSSTSPGSTTAVAGGGSSLGEPLEDIPSGFLNPIDGGSPSLACSPWTQDCPPDEKCMPYSASGGALNGTRCSPIASDPGAPGDPCTVEGSNLSGVDTCELHSICWNIDPVTDEGTCLPMCIGNESTPACPADHTCSIHSEGTLAVCLPVCDPLTQNCDAGEGCYPIDDRFVCAADASMGGGGLLELCEFINGCTPGFACVTPESAGGCDPDIAGCCVPYCSVAEPNCPTGTQCLQWFDELGTGPIGFEDVGVCGEAP